MRRDLSQVSHAGFRQTHRVRPTGRPVPPSGSNEKGHAQRHLRQISRGNPGRQAPGGALVASVACAHASTEIAFRGSFFLSFSTTFFAPRAQVTTATWPTGATTNLGQDRPSPPAIRRISVPSQGASSSRESSSSIKTAIAVRNSGVDQSVAIIAISPGVQVVAVRMMPHSMHLPVTYGSKVNALLTTAAWRGRDRKMATRRHRDPTAGSHPPEQEAPRMPTPPWVLPAHSSIMGIAPARCKSSDRIKKLSAPPLSALGISIREFAKRSGLDEKQVRRGVKEQRLKALPDGTLDPTLVGTDWRGSVRHRRRRADKTADNVRTPRLVRTEVSAASAPHGRRLTKGDAYTAGVTSGISDMASSLPAVVAQAALAVGIPLDLVRALDAVLRDRVTSTMAELLDEWQADPAVCAAGDELSHVAVADTWAAHAWPSDTLGEVSWPELEAKAADGQG